MFLRGNRFDPPRAGMTARTLGVVDMMPDCVI